MSNETAKIDPLTDEEIQWVRRFKKDCEDFCERYDESTAAWKGIQDVLLDFRKATSKREGGIPLTDYELKAPCLGKRGG